MRFIYSGPSASGKTSKMIDQYLEYRKTSQIVANGYYLVANNEHIKDVEQQILQAGSKDIIFSPAVETINTLAEKLSGKKSISEVRKQLILTDIIKKNNYFGSINDIFAVYENVSDTVKEVRNYVIDRSQLSDADGSAGIISAVIEQYEQELTDKDLYDTERILQIAQPDQQIDFLLLDGFDSFSELQKVFLAKLFSSSERVIVSLTYDQDNPDIFPDALQLRSYLLQEGFDEQYFSDSYLASELKLLNDNFLQPVAEKKICSENIGRLSADNIQLQYELIARQIIELHKTAKYRWSDFAIVLRQINEKRYLVQNVFQNYDIPVTVHEGLYLWRSALLQWILNLYKFAIDGFNKAELIEFLQSGFVNISYKDLHYLQRLFDHYPFSRTYEDIADHIQSGRIQEIYAQLKQLTSELQHSASFKEQWSLISSFCSQNKIIENLKKDLKEANMEEHARENLKAYSRLKSYYQDLQEEIAEITDLKKSYQYVEHFMTQTIIKIDKYPADRVQVFDAPSSRQKKFKVVFIADLIFGNYPLPQLNRSLLDDEQRARVGLRSYLARQEKENTIFYQLLSRATEKLYFCSYKYTIYGSEVTPSIYLDWLENSIELDPANIKHQKYSEVFMELNNISEREYKYLLANYLYANYPDYPQDEDQSVDQSELQLIRELIQKRNDLKLQRELNEHARDILQQKISSLSVTALEQYDRCPFLFFCRYILNIHTAEEFSIYAYRGSVVHKVLELFFKKYDQSRIELKEINKILAELLDDHLTDLQQRYPEQYFQAEKEMLLSKLQLFLEQLLPQIAAEELQPTKYEYQIGAGLYTFKGINIIGKVDRIDENEDCFRVIDYKTGVIDINKERLDQVLLYTLILSETGFQQKKARDPQYIKFPTCDSKSLEWDKEATLQNLNKVIGRLQKAQYYHFDRSCENNSFKQCAYANICSRIREYSDED